jgi:tetratricopeptide (TPR) repeat protein
MYNERLARFAMEGRVIAINKHPEGRPDIGLSQLIDLYTEKAVGKRADRWIYVTDRQTIVSPSWPSPRYVTMPGPSLEADFAQLFAEVVTCHEINPDGAARQLDESAWDERRRQLARHIDERLTPAPIKQLASDPWHQLRRQADRARAKSDNAREIRYLDRLIAVEPTWQNYHQRAGIAERSHSDRAQDYLEAAKRAGDGYWHQCRQERYFETCAGILIKSTTGTPQQYQLGLQLADAISIAEPEDQGRHLLVAKAHYRVGRYAEALSILDGWKRDWERKIVSQVGHFFMPAWPVPLVESQPVEKEVAEALAFLAMTYHRLDHRDRAQRILDQLRTLIVRVYGGIGWADLAFVEVFPDLLREAEALIEGRPQPAK